MGNEQSASGEGDAGENSSGCQQQPTTSGSVANGDENSCSVVVAADSWNNGPLGGSIPPSSSRSHSAASRTYSTATGGPASSSPFATRSLRIRTHHHPPTRCASVMDNVGASASHQQRTTGSNFNSSNAAVTNQAASTRSPRPAVVCRQKSAVTFSASASGAFAANSNANANAGEGGPDKSPPLASLLGLSAYQQQQIVASWPRIQQSGGHTAGAEIFRKLTSKCPPIKETFQKADVVERLAPKTRGLDIYKEHGRLLFEVFQTAVNALGANDSSDEVTDMCRGHGARHLSLRGEGFQTRMWDDLSESLVEHVTRLDAVRRHRELMRAWTALIMFLVEKMKEGYDSGLRKSSSPAVSSPFSHRGFGVGGANAGSFGDDESDLVGGAQSAGRRLDRKLGFLRKDDQQLEAEREAEEEIQT